MNTKKKISICLTVKNRSCVTYKSEDLNAEEAAYFMQVENIFNIVKKENRTNNAKNYTIKQKFKEPFTYTLDCINSLKDVFECDNRLHEYDVEVVIADWKSSDYDLHSLTACNYPFKINVIDVVSDLNFSRGHGLNVAASHSSGDFLFFVDADMLFCNASMIYEMLQMCNKGISCWPVCYKLRDPIGYGSYPEWAGYGICMMTKPQFEKYGPWPEYKTWGKEDLDIFNRFVDNGEQIFRKSYHGYMHQWHTEHLRVKEYEKN